MKQLIKQILKEESESKIKKAIEEVVEHIILPDLTHIICKIDILSPSETEIYTDNKNFKMVITFIGGYGTRYWPNTLAMIDMYEKLMNMIWDDIYNYTGVAISIYSKKVKSCE